MKQRTYIYFLLILLNANVCGAQSFEIDSTTNALLQQGLHQVHIEKYNEAIEAFNEIIKLHPQHPAGYFCVAAVYQTIMRNYRMNAFESRFDSLLHLYLALA